MFSEVTQLKRNVAKKFKFMNQAKTIGKLLMYLSFD